MNITELTPNDVILKELGKRLAAIRSQQKHSQESLAAEAGIGVATLRRIELGRSGQLESWIKIIKAIGMMSQIESFLPENYKSPMATVLGKRNRRKAKEDSDEGPIRWGDET